MEDLSIKCCPACGAKNNLSARFCNMCGGEVQTPPAPRKEEALPEKKPAPGNDDVKRKKSQEVLIMWIVVGIFIVIYVLANIGENMSSTSYSISPNSDSLSKTSPTPTLPEARPRIDAPEIQARIQRGKQLFERLSPKIPGEGNNPSVSGHLTETPRLTFFITNELWDKLSKEQQIDLTWYFESFIPTAKRS